MRKIIILTLLCINFQSIAQNQKKRTEFSTSFLIFPRVFGSYYGQFERFHSPTHSSTLTLGVQTPSIIFLWSKIQYSGQRIDFGHRWYYKGDKYNVVKLFAGANATFEKGNLKLNQSPFASIPLDSMQLKGFAFAPEINAGIKITFLKRLTITPALGFRYYFNSFKTQNITFNQNYWQYNDWDNTNLKWEDNRKTVELLAYRKGLTLIPYINIGFVLKK